MKQFSVVLVLFCFLTLGSSWFSYAEETTISLAVGEFQPFVSENLKHYGVACRIVTEAFAMEGIKVKYKWYVWKRAYSKVKNGEIDGSVAWVPNEERKKDVYFTDSVFDAFLVFFHLKNYPFDWDTIEDLKGIRIGGTIGYYYGEKFQNAEKEGILTVDRSPDDRLNLRKMLKGRIQIFPINIDSGYALIRANNNDQFQLFTYHPKPVDIKRQYCLIFSKKNKRSKQLTETFNKGLKRLKASGKYDQFFIESRRGDYLID